MARRVLGNDPFVRGAPERAEAREPIGPAETPAEDVTEPLPLPELPPSLAGPDREPAPVPRVRRRRTRLKPVVVPAASLPVPAPRAIAPPPVPAREPASPSADQEHLSETVGARLRNLFERQLPTLLEGLARSSVEALGLTAQPVPVSEVDAFGLSQEFVDRWQPVLARVLESYFRAEIAGVERIPNNRPAILVCNHSGILPYDELLLSVALRAATSGRGSGLNVRPLSEDFAINAPFAGSWLNRFGLVRASQDNAERLLSAGAVVAVFPEGSQGIAKLYRNRYQLQRFGRGGFIRLALRTQVPIFPVALVGGEEAQPVLARIRLPRPLQPPLLPLTPTFPWLGLLGLLPLPTRWRIEVGEPLQWRRPPADANDRPLVAALTEDVRQTLQAMLDRMLRERKTVFL
ncbi:MAG TPA: lysophospholipid acyltransferase family protein [Myxococcales bacterium]|nr:lysophospholipid acyltransferase family protein [Myxococcales bacterium]